MTTKEFISPLLSHANANEVAISIPRSMSRLSDTWNKARHAGLVWTARAVWRRAQKRIALYEPLRTLVERSHLVNEGQFDSDIDFDNCRQGDIAERFIHHPLGHHFLDTAVEIASWIRTHSPESESRALDSAEALCRREFHLLGRDVTFDDNIDWFWIPETSKRWPILPVEQYSPGFYNAPDRPGDIKYPWELNRHQHFVTLAKAFLFSGDSKYSNEIARQLSEWEHQNPFRMGINWYSSLELAIRLISWTNTIALLRAAPNANAKLVKQLLRCAYQHAHYLDRTLTTHWLVANNHLVGETAGLFAFATTFPEFGASLRWRDRAHRILADALTQQIFSDGVNREQATGYHRFVLDFIVLVDKLALLNNVEISDRIRATLKAMIKYEAAIAPPDGGLAPTIGDCDDGRGLVLSESAELLDFRGWLPYGAVRFNDTSLVEKSHYLGEESAWLLGLDDLNRYKSMPPSDERVHSVAFSEGGHYVLRANTEHGTTSVFVRSGQFGLGQNGSSVHSHADILSPIIHWKGRPLSVDSGTYGYLCDAQNRDRLRAGRSHNTFLPDGQDQGEIRSLWNWSKVPYTRVSAWSSTDDRAELQGHLIAPIGFHHQRKIVLQRSPLTLIFEDDLSYLRGSKAVWRLHLAPQLEAEELDAETMRIYDGEGFSVHLHYVGYSHSRIVDTQIAPKYGRWLQIRCVELISDKRPAVCRVVLSDTKSQQTEPRKG